jgi:membrane protease YdiL (CAAX protease family)
MLLAIGNHLLISGAMDLLIPHLGKLGEDYIDMMNVFFEGNVILTFISTIILAPISEELIFRGVIMKKARHAFPFAVANVMQALLFGVLHGNIIQGTYAFVLGLSLGYVTYKFESILPAILIHCMLNLLGSYLLYSVPTFVQILEVILGIGIIVYTVRILNKMKPYVSMDIN